MIGSRPHLPILVVALLAAVVGSAGWQSQQPFRSGTDLVLLAVTADDGRGNVVTGLERADFQVLEDGRPQDIAFFAREPQPMTVAVLIDTSSSMERRLTTAQEAAVGFVRRLRPEDQAEVISFNSSIEVLQPFTSDINLLESALRRTRAGGSTSLYSAIAVGFGELARVSRQWPAGEIRRKGIIVLSDGEDTTSLIDYEELIRQAQRTDAAIYAIAMRDARPSPGQAFNSSNYVLRTMSQSTGGQVFFVHGVEQLDDIYTQIADELASQYMIGFISTNAERDGTWRQVSVRVARPGVVARTRTGYFAPKMTP